MQRLTREPAIQRRSYRPEARSCPSCQSTLKRSHILWRKRLITLSGPVQVISWGYRCPKATCGTTAVVYRSTAAAGLHLRKHQFSRAVIVQVGYRRFWYHQTSYELHAWLTQDLGLAVSARQVANLVADFLALLQAAQPAKIRAALQPLKSLVVGLDGMQPAKGDTCLYIVRELQTDVTLCAENLDDSADATIRTRVLQPLKALAQELGLPWYGVVSDAQDTIRTAVSTELAGVPHQACQSHCLRAAGALTFQADQTMKKLLKAAFRAALKRVEQRIADLPAADLFRPILADYAAALRATLLEGGIAPFELGGVHIFDDLTALAASLERCRKKGGPADLLRRLVKVADHRLVYADQVAQLRRQRQWLIDLAHLLAPTPVAGQPPPTSPGVAHEVDHYLVALLAPDGPATNETDHQVAVHIDQSFRNRWWGLFTCYDVPELPRTNNELERYMRRIKTGQRRILGHKDVHDFLIRYGRYVACVDYRESPAALLARLSQVTQDDFQRARQAMDGALLREQKRHRFRHHQADYLGGLESQWATAIEKSTE